MDDLDLAVAGKGLRVSRQASAVPAVVAGELALQVGRHGAVGEGAQPLGAVGAIKPAARGGGQQRVEAKKNLAMDIERAGISGEWKGLQPIRRQQSDAGGRAEICSLTAAATRGVAMELSTHSTEARVTWREPCRQNRVGRQTVGGGVGRQQPGTAQERQDEAGNIQRRDGGGRAGSNARLTQDRARYPQPLGAQAPRSAGALLQGQARAEQTVWRRSARGLHRTYADSGPREAKGGAGSGGGLHVDSVWRGVTGLRDDAGRTGGDAGWEGELLGGGG